ncbi:hypothetical protein HG263_06040 [Pseudoalteromonas sp. JBTF-M23]|uniref:Zn-ribbon motif protein n=1 Tax=Pseudoalteromonas caenipelagi TaxID=2726988 RepID=A0A849V944_9GAMM|nr:hypothetical protein [Pseudoalteromonas caenipelagi]NOU50099.1 hypothetical protein [Pseudoalteromonas caenipelagi]
MAKPNKKGPVRTVDIYCAGCSAALFKYRKGGKGALVKCFIERIVKNHTNNNCHCPSCEQEFGRSTLIRGAPAIKFVGGKVRFK